MLKKEKKMKYWLKLIGSSTKPITDRPFYGKYDEEYIGFRKERMPAIRMGDHVFLYAPGGSMSIFALTEAMSAPEHGYNYNPKQEGSCRWKMWVRYLMNLPVDHGINIDEVNFGDRNLALSIRRQSHIKLSPEEYMLAFDKLQKKARK